MIREGAPFPHGFHPDQDGGLEEIRGYQMNPFKNCPGRRAETPPTPLQIRMEMQTTLLKSSRSFF